MWLVQLEHTASTSRRSSPGFSNGTHLVVDNVGHEQVLTHPMIQDAVLDFLRGKDVRRAKAVWPPIKFVPIEKYDPEVTHPALARR